MLDLVQVHLDRALALFTFKPLLRVVKLKDVILFFKVVVGELPYICQAHCLTALKEHFLVIQGPLIPLIC